MPRILRVALVCLIAATRTLAAAQASATPLPLPAGTTSEIVDVYGTARAAVRLQGTGALATSLASVEPASRLVTAVAVADSPSAVPLRFRVVLEHAGGRTELYTRTIDPADPRDRRWIDVGCPLEPSADGPSLVRFEVESTRPGSAATLLIAPPAVIACGQDAPSVLLVTAAELHGDAPAMPRLDRFAADAVRFTHAFAGTPSALLALQQLMTGSYFPESRRTPGLAGLVAGVAPEATRAIVGDSAAAAWIAGERPGFGSVVSSTADARAVTSEALRFLTAFGRCGTTLHVHYGVANDPRAGDTGGRQAVRRDDLDRAVARLLRGIARRGRLDDTTIAISGMPDWTSGADGAGPLSDHALNVPLVMRVPGVPPGTVAAPVGSVDVLPTLSATANRMPSASDGESLLPSMRGSPAPVADRLVFSRVESGSGGVPEQMLRTSTRKLVHRVADGTFAFYDLTNDPTERRDLGTISPDARTLVRAFHGIEARLAETGYQLRLQSRRPDPVGYAVTLTSARKLPLVAVEGINLEGGDTLAWDPARGTLTLRGTLEAHGEDRVRFDGPDPGAGVEIAVMLNGISLPPETVRLGAQATAPAGPVPLADPRVAGEPRRRDATDETRPDVEVAFWGVPPATDESGMPPPADEEERERLRQLGYID